MIYNNIIIVKRKRNSIKILLRDLILDLCKEKKKAKYFIVYYYFTAYNVFFRSFYYFIGVYVIKETTTFHCESLE